MLGCGTAPCDRADGWSVVRAMGRCGRNCGGPFSGKKREPITLGGGGGGGGEQ